MDESGGQGRRLGSGARELAEVYSLGLRWQFSRMVGVLKRFGWIGVRMGSCTVEETSTPVCIPADEWLDKLTVGIIPQVARHVTIMARPFHFGVDLLLC
jgi:hypothetical protein